ncbi:MAG TPA: hypothetical protein PKA62_14225 [Thermoanaerobaculia bacterium]|nr:hypothetical protein [Thermoanaerobaculia bacterium]
MSGVEETRRALCAFEADGLEGGPARGEGEARIDDDGVSVGGLRVEFLDVDVFPDERRVLTLGLHPAGALRISMLARRHETFAKALGEARDAARVRGLLAHGLGSPEAFDGALLEPGPARDARLLLWPTHVAVVPAGADPFQLPLGGVTDVRFTEGTWEVVLDAPSGPFHFGRLARRTDAFARAVRAARAAMLDRWSGAPPSVSKEPGRSSGGPDASAPPSGSPSCSTRTRRVSRRRSRSPRAPHPFCSPSSGIASSSSSSRAPPPPPTSSGERARRSGKTSRRSISGGAASPSRGPRRPVRRGAPTASRSGGSSR